MSQQRSDRSSGVAERRVVVVETVREHGSLVWSPPLAMGNQSPWERKGLLEAALENLECEMSFAIEDENEEEEL